MCCSKCRLEKCLSVGMTRKDSITQHKHHLNVENNTSIRWAKPPILVDEFLSNSIASHLNEYGDNYRIFEPKPQLKLSSRTKRFATNLSPFENEQIEQVQSARKVFVDEFSVPIIRPTSQVVEIFRIPEIYFRWTIKFCKYFPAFNCLSADDKFALLKPFSFDMSAIHFAFMYDPETNGYPMFEVC